MSADSTPTDSDLIASTRAPPSSAPSPPSSQSASPTPAAGLFDRVLVVTDDSPAGRVAASTALDIAAAHDSAVDALYVVDTTEHWDMVVERREATGERLVETVEMQGRDVGVDVDKWFRYGTAHEEVLDFAASHDVDLIVVGSARRTGLDRLVHPETLPVRVQRGADAPVMVVGPDEK